MGRTKTTFLMRNQINFCLKNFSPLSECQTFSETGFSSQVPYFFQASQRYLCRCSVYKICEFWWRFNNKWTNCLSLQELSRTKQQSRKCFMLTRNCSLVLNSQYFYLFCWKYQHMNQWCGRKHGQEAAHRQPWLSLNYWIGSLIHISNGA